MYKTSLRDDVGSNAGEVSRYSTLKYPFRLNFYGKPPLGDVTIEEFELFAIDRLRVLGEIESSWARNRPQEELKKVVGDQCGKYVPLSNNTAKTVELDEQRRKDHIGHFVLRLAFCRSEELRKRFVKAETALFRVRYDADDTQERQQFLGSMKFDWSGVTHEEGIALQDQLNTLIGTPEENTDFSGFLKVKWTRIPDLVEKRRVVLKGGWAYVPATEQSALVFHEFQTTLERALEATAKALPRLDEDTRIIPMLNNLSQGFLSGANFDWGSSTATTAGGVTADMIDEMARKHFPLCMRYQHEELRKRKHLPHFSRLEYGLFLKVLGLPIEEALVFWRKSFSKITDDKFNKEYKYNIRHSFGLEGKRANYPAKTCMQIIMERGQKDMECHGCPFVIFAPENLQTALMSMYNVGSQDMGEILHLVKGQHYHVACTRVWEISHGVKKGAGLDGESVTHPNLYAAKSREFEKARTKEEGGEDVVMAEG